MFSLLLFSQVFEEALKTWTEKQKIERPVSPRHHSLGDDEMLVLQSFVDATEGLIRRWDKGLIRSCHGGTG